MQVTYLAGPYSNPDAFIQCRNIRHARDVAQHMWLEGKAVICPHMNTAWFEGPRQIFINGDLEILSRCDEIFMLQGWASSDGAKGELDLARRMGLRIEYEEDVYGLHA